MSLNDVVKKLIQSQMPDNAAATVEYDTVVNVAFYLFRFLTTLFRYESPNDFTCSSLRKTVWILRNLFFMDPIRSFESSVKYIFGHHLLALFRDVEGEASANTHQNHIAQYALQYIFCSVIAGLFEGGYVLNHPDYVQQNQLIGYEVITTVFANLKTNFFLVDPEERLRMSVEAYRAFQAAFLNPAFKERFMIPAMQHINVTTLFKQTQEEPAVRTLTIMHPSNQHAHLTETQFETFNGLLLLADLEEMDAVPDDEEITRNLDCYFSCDITKNKVEVVVEFYLNKAFGFVN